MAFQLYKYQQELEKKIYAKWRERSVKDPTRNKKSMVVQLCTGGGKTVIFSDIAKKSSKKGTNTLIITHREELLSQTTGTLVNFDLKPSIVNRYTKHPPESNLTVAMTGTLARRIKKPEWAEWYKKIDLIVIDECFTGGTEILTENGFQRFDKLDKSLKVAQYDKGNISFVNPLRHIERKHNGDMTMFHVRDKIDVPMTCGHMQLFHSKSNGFYKSKISDVKFNYSKEIAVSGKIATGDDSLTSLERLYIATQADGSIHYCSEKCTHIAFSLSKQRKIDRLLSLCKDGNIPIKEVKNKNRNTRRFMVKMPIGTTKNICNHISFPMSYEKANEIIEEMVLWDGSIISKNNFYYYSSVEKSQVDFYNSVATICGHSCYISMQKDDRKESYRDVYRLFINLNHPFKSCRSMSTSKYQYKGNVYCVEVPSGSIVVRHNGFTFISGNCHEQLFNWIFKNPLSKGKFILGFTATPNRKGKQRQLCEDYEDMVTGPDIQELINMGYLVTDRYFSVPIDLSNVSMKGGEYDSTEMYNKYNHQELYSGIVDNWKKLWRNTITLTFCCNIQHCIKTCKAFNNAGIKAKFIVSKLAKPKPLTANATKEEIVKFGIKTAEYENYTENFSNFSGNRETIINEWKRGEFYVLINAGIATTGFDFRPIQTVIMYRVTTSENLLQQVMGRGSRILNEEETKKYGKKTYFNFADFGENCKRLQCYYRQEHKYSLEHEEYKPGNGTPAYKNCPKCQALVIAQSSICKYCGYIFPKSHTEKIVELTEISYGEAIKKLETPDDYEVYAENSKPRKSKNWVFRMIFIKWGKAGLKAYAKTHHFSDKWVYVAMKRYQAQGIRRNEK